MEVASLLGQLHHQYIIDANHPTSLDRLLDAHLNQAEIADQLIEQALASSHENITSSMELIDRWRSDALLLMILQEHHLLENHRAMLEVRVQRLHAFKQWPGHQVVTAYCAVVDLLLGFPHCAPMPLPHASGFYSGHALGEDLWSIPHPMLQTELGIVWCLYYMLSKNAEVLEAAYNLTKWQLRTLTHDFKPFAGLFSQEGNTSQGGLLAFNYVLFKSISALAQNAEMAYVAEQQLLPLTAAPQPHNLTLFGLGAMVERYCAKHFEPISPKAFELARTFEEPHLALVGQRSPQTSAFATLYGRSSGMGALHSEQVSIVNFGPQHLPLGDCEGFGLAGSEELLAAHIKVCHAKENMFEVEGIARMSCHPGDAFSGLKQNRPSGIWLDTKLRYEEGCYSIETAFKSLYKDAVVFTFFCKALSCLVNGHLLVKPRSFQRYKGQVLPVELSGQSQSLTILSCNSASEMHVIPLSGGDNFWGADFLVAYLCPMRQQSYSWTLQQKVL